MISGVDVLYGRCRKPLVVMRGQFGVYNADWMFQTKFFSTFLFCSMVVVVFVMVVLYCTLL